MSAPLSGEVPLEGMRLEVKTVKNIMLFDGGEKPKEITTNAVTVAELLSELNIELGPQDKVEEGEDFKLTDGAEVHISRTGVSMVNRPRSSTPRSGRSRTRSLEQGKEIVEDAGTPGEKIVTYRVTKKNGKDRGQGRSVHRDRQRGEGQGRSRGHQAAGRSARHRRVGVGRARPV